LQAVIEPYCGLDCAEAKTAKKKRRKRRTLIKLIAFK